MGGRDLLQGPGTGPVRRARLLTIAGSDSGGGAGIQADLKTFAAHGVYGMSALTAVTAQNTLGVRAVFALPPAMVAAQIDAVFEDLGVDAIKIGMLAEAAIVRAVAARLVHHLGEPSGPGRPPVVLDPVLAAKGGAPLLADDAVAAVLEDLLPLASLVTPNVPELERLTGLPAGTEEERLTAARALSRSVPGRGVAVLAKGGHAMEKPEEVVDLLVIPRDGGGEEVHRFAAPRLPGRSTHGTGCTLSSAIAARLASPGGGQVGEDLPAAVAGAIGYLRGAIAAAYPLGQGTGPVDHLWLWQNRGEGGSE